MDAAELSQTFARHCGVLGAVRGSLVVMSHVLARLSVGAALLGLGGLFGAALTAGSDSTPAPAAAVSPERQPAEVRTVVKRRTVHVYRKPKHRRRRRRDRLAAPPLRLRLPAPVAPAPAVAPAPVRASQPLVTRTSGSGRSDEDGEDRGEHEGREHEGGDD